MDLTTQDTLTLIDEKASKVDFMLNKFMCDYNYIKAPSYDELRTMVKGWAISNPVQSNKVKQAQKWALGYNDVFTSITIAFDYVVEMKQLLQDLIKKAGENK